MKAGDIVNGYTILQDFSTAGGGLCQWTFAKKGEKYYFLKEFLSPTYPVESAPGSPKIKDQKRRECAEFERHHLQLKETLSAQVSEGGNLIVSLDFFRHGARYYKVTEKVDVSTMEPEQIAMLPIDRRILLLKTIAHSLSILHRHNIVHGDLKPDNVLIKQTKTGDYVTKLIDFDNSYFAGSPPSNEETVGDIKYWSPELARYIHGDPSLNPTEISMASDIFTLGLLYSQYLTGNLPIFDGRYKYCWESVNDGKKLHVQLDDEKKSTGLKGTLAKKTNMHETTSAETTTTISKLKGTLTKPKISTLPTVASPSSSSVTAPLPDLLNRMSLQDLLNRMLDVRSSNRPNANQVLNILKMWGK